MYKISAAIWISTRYVLPAVSDYRKNTSIFASIPSIFRALNGMLNVAHAYRDRNKYIAVSKQFPLWSGHHHFDHLKGNLGVILFSSSSGLTLGRNWIAPSRKIRSEVRLQALEAGHALLHYCADGTISMQEWNAGQDRRIPVSMAPEHEHANDSEHVLLNTLAAELGRYNITSGQVWLLTERLPCASCTKIIAQFLSDFPAIRVNIAYLFDYVNKSARRSHCDFFAELPTTTVVNVKLFKYDALVNGGQKLTHIPPGTALLTYNPKYIFPGAPRFSGVREGKKIVTAWREDDAHELRMSLLIDTSKS